LAARIIGIGQPMAGDDGVGIAVADFIGSRTDCADIEVVRIAEPSRLVSMLTDGADPVILIDAVLDAGKVGRVVVLDPQGRPKAKLLSTHGVGVREAIALARTLEPQQVASRIAIVGVTIGRVRRSGEKLSDEIAAAVPKAAEQALKLARQ
jgi:hydrogenase maturation protease